ncbi:DegT/DnrJ/EryC1/StrS family aminotransferase [Streptomyces sp. P38-E01]|uniref:DegT/DnrJ/EryC1/StrS family aminotransferase n=1 Tax=Streptomyces tardus TaxID=2780544 RepID=A0A949JHJ3_9ACTN|nr:DegT/DnrJ/EryC1/StrS family aminotransferase [Streptomyces tardus]MBU7600251.1 DegT/DnrJ/EryC1/StrS family aminotransferase [Streptomyces tardus]
MAMTQLAALGLRPGDEVVLPSYGGDRAAREVQLAGAVPVFADIDPLSFCLSPSSAEAVMSERTVAIVAIHLFGHPADMVRLEELAQRRGAELVEDGRSLGEIPSGQALRRRERASFLGSRLRGVLPPQTRAGAEHAFEEYVVRVPGNGRPDRDVFRHALRARGIECYVPIVTPAHRARGLRTAQWLQESELAAEQGLALTLEDSMSRRQLSRIASACNSLGGLLMEPAC